MNRITLHQLLCYVTEDADRDHCRLIISLDGGEPIELNEVMSEGDSWIIARTYEFRDTVSIWLYDEDDFNRDDLLGAHVIRAEEAGGVVVLPFQEDDADYLLTVVLTNARGEPLNELQEWSMRDHLSQLGKGVMDARVHENNVLDHSIYRVGNEMVSFARAKALNAPQDGAKSNTNSLREWIGTHCDFNSPETVRVTRPAGGEARAFLTNTYWRSVDGEQSRELSGFVRTTKLTDVDNPITHETMDWNWNVVPSPQHMYLLGAGFESHVDGLPELHNEWESGSFPLQWRPFTGQYSTVVGRHIWDVAHAPVRSEIHPGHTIVNQHTAAASIGRNGELVPVNRAVIGMGMSGGFIGTVAARWNQEFGGVIRDLPGDSEDCWPTNLERHPHTFWLFPPVERPEGAELTYNLRVCQHISLPNRDRQVDFLRQCTNDRPFDDDDDEGLAFRLFDQMAGFDAQDVEERFQPQMRQINDAHGNPSHYEVTVDLAGMPGIPAGYYAVLECGWNILPAHQQMQRYRVVFEEFDVQTQNDDSIYNDDEWSFFFGVNGRFHAKWYDQGGVDFGVNVMDAELNTFIVDLVDDQPMIIQDNGHDRDSGLASAGRIDSVYLRLHGPDIFRSIQQQGLTVVATDTRNRINNSTNMVRFKVEGRSGDTDHTWTIRIEKIN